MRFRTAAEARSAAFDCEAWSRLSTNASREASRGDGYVHDTYESPFTGDFDRAADALLRYEIFAPRRMYSHVCTPDRRVSVEATIIQRVVLGPGSIETAVRVIEVERTPGRAFFAYATLQGHPERGIASFSVTRGHGQHTFEAEAWSRAGTVLTTLARPVSRALQRAMTREAVSSFCTLHRR